MVSFYQREAGRRPRQALLLGPWRVLGYTAEAVAVIDLTKGTLAQSSCKLTFCMYECIACVPACLFVYTHICEG